MVSATVSTTRAARCGREAVGWVRTTWISARTPSARERARRKSSTCAKYLSSPRFVNPKKPGTR